MIFFFHRAVCALSRLAFRDQSIHPYHSKAFYGDLKQPKADQGRPKQTKVAVANLAAVNPVAANPAGG